MVQKQAAHALFVLSGAQQRGINDILRPRPQRLQQAAFPGNSLGDGQFFADGDGVLAAGLLIAALDDGIVGIEEKDLVLKLAGIQVGKRLLQLLAAAHTAHVHNNGYAVQLVFALQGEVHDTGQQRHRDIIDAEKTNVLQRVDGHRFARAGQARYDHKFHAYSPTFILLRGSPAPAYSRFFAAQWP